MEQQPRLSPVLVGREDLLELGQRRARAARQGAGHLLLLAGEAGIGKSRLLTAILDEAAATGLRHLVAAAFPRDLELAGAIVLDLADRLLKAPWPAGNEVGRLLMARLVEADELARGDRHRHRRLLVLDVVGLISRLADDGPLAIGLEDLHWSDDLTLEIVSHLARDLTGKPLLIVGTYRSDELYPRVPMREWRSRLLSQRLAEEARLPRLGLPETARMAAMLTSGELPRPQQLVEALHRRSDGIPLHIEELLTALSADGADTTPTELPASLADAVIQRAELLSPEARSLADSAAVIGRSFDLDAICALHGTSPETAGRLLDELQQRFFIVESRPAWFDFRHALIRDALEAALDPARRMLLHRRVAEAAAARPDLGGDAFLSAHFELGGLPEPAFRHARLAAARAVELSAHREALVLARRALRTAPTDLPPSELAELLALTAQEEAATDDNAAAAATLERARDVLRQAGDALAAAELAPPLSAARHLLGDGLEVRAQRLEAELAAVESANGGDHGVRGRLLAALAAAHMLDRRLDASIDYGRRALAVARTAGDQTTELNIAATLGSCLIFAGQMDAGWRMLEDGLARARRARLEAEAARAYRMIGTSASVLVEYARAERWLHEGIDFAERTEQWNHRHYMAAHLAHVAWATGDWNTAERLAEQALADGRGGITTTITTLHVLGYLAMGRGVWSRAQETLTEARERGEQMGELQRFSPALWGLAEAALLSGRAPDAVGLTAEGHAASQRVADAAYLYPFLVTGTRARLAMGDVTAAREWAADVAAQLERRGIWGTLPAIDHARGLLELSAGATGRARTLLEAARQGWTERRRWWEGQWAALDLARCHFRANRPADAAQLVNEVRREAQRVAARPLLDAAAEIDRRLRASHPIEETWAPLTAREAEVARLIARGMTNRQIADTLRISARTASSHVEHILARLGAANRAEIAAWVTERQPAEGG